jgi:anaerobic magnesium-protoporphyrin IX monomethyl ester cyclase
VKVCLLAPPMMDVVDGSLRTISMDAERECPPYGIYMLAAALRAAGHEVALVDLIAEQSVDLTPHEQELRDCELVGVGATSLSWPSAKVVLHQIEKLLPTVPIVLGGIHPTMFDRYVLQTSPATYVVRGEGERALLQLCECVSRGVSAAGVPGLTWKAPDGSITRNPVPAKIDNEELASFPVPDYSLLAPDVYKGLAIESSRGCAFDCSFCSTSYRRTWRPIPAEDFVDRLTTLMPHLPRTRYRTMHVIDDEFSMNPRRAVRITELLHDRGLEPWLVYDSRANDLLFPGYVEGMADLTCQFLVGAECGYDEGLKKIGKGTTTEKLRQAAAKLARFGISERADFSFMLGLPWESMDEIRATIRFAAGLHAEFGVRILLQWYLQIPGSRLWEADRSAGLVSEAMYDDFGFFRNLYLFRTGVRISPSEFYEIAHMVEGLQRATRVRYPGRRMVEFTFPSAIATYFPVSVMNTHDSGLVRLREVSRPGKDLTTLQPTHVDLGVPEVAEVPVGVPRRHFVGYQ